jgi:hypothetical protein
VIDVPTCVCARARVCVCKCVCVCVCVFLPAVIPLKNETSNDKFNVSFAAGKRPKSNPLTVSKTKNLVMIKGTSLKRRGSNPSYNPRMPMVLYILFPTAKKPPVCVCVCMCVFLGGE